MAARSTMVLPPRKAIHRLSWVVHLVPGGVAIVFFLLAVLVLDPRPPFTVSQGIAVNSPVHPGETLKVDWVQTWTRRCTGESERSVTRSDKKVDTYEKVIIYPPDKLGTIPAVGEAQLSKVTPSGPATYRAKVTFPAQLSWGCIMLRESTFTTPGVPFVVAKAE